MAETGTKFAVGILPYLVMGRFTGAGARAFAEANSLERTAFGKFAASEMQTQVAGAAIYDAAKNPREGENSRRKRCRKCAHFWIAWLEARRRNHSGFDVG